MTNTKPSRSFQKFSNPWKVSKYQPHSTFQNLLKASIGELSCLPLSPSSSSDVHNHHHSKSTSRKQLWSGGQDFYQGQVIPHEKSSMEKNPNWANLSTPLPPWQRHPYPPPVNHADASKSSSTIHLIPASPSVAVLATTFSILGAFFLHTTSPNPPRAELIKLCLTRGTWCHKID